MTIVPKFSISFSSHRITLSLRGFTNLSTNSETRFFVSSRSVSVKKEISPSWNESGICTDVGFTIVRSCYANNDFAASILAVLSSSKPLVTAVGEIPETFARYASKASS